MKSKIFLSMSYKEKMFILEEDDCYKILGVERSADFDTISRAYKNLAKELHPDKNINAATAEKEKIQLIFQKITSAFNTLKDPVQKERHDFELRQASARIEAAAAFQERAKNNLTGFQFTQVKPVNEAELEKKAAEYIQKTFDRAKNLIEQEQYDDAIELLRKLTDRKPQEARFHSYLGLAMEGKGWSGYAQAEFKVALHYDQNDEIAKKHYKGASQPRVKKKPEIQPENKGILGKLKSFIKKQAD